MPDSLPNHDGSKLAKVAHDVWAFIESLFVHYVTILGGGIVIVFINQWERYLGHNISTGLYWTLALALLLMACFLAWRDQHRARVEAEKTLKDEEPKIMFGLLVAIDWSNLDSFNEYVFVLTNYGKRPARYIHIEPIKSVAESYTLHFQDEDILLADGHYRSVGHEIEHEQKRVLLGKRILWDFLHNNPVEQKMVEYEVVINFKDLEEQKQHTARMRFDLEARKLTIDQN